MEMHQLEIDPGHIDGSDVFDQSTTDAARRINASSGDAVVAGTVAHPLNPLVPCNSMVTAWMKRLTERFDFPALKLIAPRSNKLSHGSNLSLRFKPPAQNSPLR